MSKFQLAVKMNTTVENIATIEDAFAKGHNEGKKQGYKIFDADIKPVQGAVLAQADNIKVVTGYNPRIEAQTEILDGGFTKNVTFLSAEVFDLKAERADIAQGRVLFILESLPEFDKAVVKVLSHDVSPRVKAALVKALGSFAAPVTV